MKIQFIFIIFLFLISTNVSAIDTKAKQAIVIDFDTNEVIFEKKPDEKIHPASLTKILSVYIAFDRLTNSALSIDDTCIVSPKAYRMGGSRMFLEIDDKVSINELLKGIIIQSGNDSSVVLAECLGGTESDFSNLMNIYSEKLGMKNSNFVNSSGWPDDNHYSTVRDIGIISNALIKDFPDLYTYFSEKEFTYNNIKQPNRNKLLNNFNGADGLKTGYVRSAGWGIAASALRENRRITVVISSTNSARTRLNESTNLLNWAFTQTYKKKILEKNQLIKNVDVWLGNHSTINLIVKNDYYSTLSYDQLQSIKSKLEYLKPISAPIKEGEEIGKIIIDIPGKPIKSISLVAEKNVKSINPLYKAFSAIKYLIFGTSLDEF